MKKIISFLFVAALFLSNCSKQPTFELAVDISNNNSLLNKKFIVNQQIDGQVVDSDTIKIKKNNFTLELPYKGPGLMNISIPESNIKDLMLVAEEGVVQLFIDGVKVRFEGTPLNDRLQAFYNGNDSISQLFQQIDIQRRSESNTPELRVEMNQKRSQLLNDNTDRIVAFIRENVDNQVGEYYFMTHYITFPMDLKIQLNSFATDKLKKEFGLH